MANTIDSFSTNSLAPISFIGGSYRELAFDVFNSAGSPVNITSFTACQWTLSPFGQPEVVTLFKTGVKDTTVTNRFWVYLYSTDTVYLSGKYIQQPTVIAMADYEFRLGQGYVNIVPSAGFTSMADGKSFTDQLIAISGSITSFESDVSGSIVSFENEVSGSVSQISGSIVTFENLVSGSIAAFKTEVSGSAASFENRKVVSIPLNTISALTGTEVNYISIPAILNGWYLYDARASCSGSSTSGSPTFMVSKTSGSVMSFTNMLTTAISIDEGEFDSSTATSQRVISTSASSVFTGYKIKVAPVAYGANVTYAQVSLTFAK